MSKAVSFISFDLHTKRFSVNAEAATLLRGLKGPICILSVCGRARQGKSTLLNRILLNFDQQQQQSGFATAASTKPCTKGLWLWSKPIKMTSKGKEVSLLLLDAEGIDAYDQTADYSTQIFSLAVLLSSLLCFNQMGSIDESSIDKLSSVSEFARLIQSKAGTSSDLSPSFVWLLRDFSLSLTREDGRGKLTATEYMEEALATMPGSSSQVLSRNSMRTSIKTVFPKRECFTLVRPCLEEKQLEDMHRIQQRDLRPEFNKGLKDLTDLLLEKISPKKFDGQCISGSALASLAESFCKVINDGKVPSIQTTWQSVMAAENALAVEAAVRAYEQSLNTVLASATTSNPADKDLTEALDQAHHASLDIALLEFSKAALGGIEERRGGEAKVKAQAQSRFNVIKQSKVAEAESKLSELLSAATSKLIPLLNAPSLDTNKLEADLRAILQSYALAPGGPSKFKKCVEFLVNTVIAGMFTGINKSSAALLNASTQLESLKKEASDSKEVIRDLNHRITLLESSAASTKSQISSAQQECERLRRDLTDRVQSEARLRSEEEQARRKILDLERSISTMHAEEGGLKSELGRVRLELSQRSETASALTAELAKAHAEFRRLEQEGQDRGSAHSSLSLEVQALTSKLIERDATIKALQEERNQLTRLASPAQRPAPPPPAAAASLNKAMDVDEAIESVVGTKRRRVTPQGQGHQAALVTNVVAPPAAAHASSTPHEREVEMGRRRSGPQGGAPLSGHTEPENLSKMTVQEMKAWLTERQFEADVFELNSKKPKKQDWSNLISSKCV